MRALYGDLNRAVSAVLQDPASPYNFGLRFNKWAPFATDGQKLKFDKDEYQRAGLHFKQWINRQRTILTQAIERRDSYAKTAGCRKEIAVQFEAKVSTPLVIGIGGAHPAEVGLTFHWTTGVPYLPASSLKGLARFVFEIEEINKAESLEKLKEQRQVSCSVWTGDPFRGDDGKPRPPEPLINGDMTNRNWPPTVEHFGSQDAMGTVRFLDALPMPDGLALQLDIMNPHYPDYYAQGGGPGPTECQNPVPILFWTVAPGARFRFTLMAHEQHRSQLEQATVCLRTGLEVYGIGAKTAVGYGRLRYVEGSEAKWGGAYDRERAEREQAERVKAEQAAREQRAQGLQQQLDSDCQQVRTFKGAQDKSRLEAILKRYDSWNLTAGEREHVAQQLEQVLTKDLRKGKLGDTLRQWRKT